MFVSVRKGACIRLAGCQTNKQNRNCEMRLRMRCSNFGKVKRNTSHIKRRVKSEELDNDAKA